MKIMLIRHGATPGNLEKRYVGSTDEPLTKEARTELARMRRRYPVPQYVVESPMKRCRETASALFPGIDAVTEQDLRECEFGKFEYKNYQELSGNEAYQRWIDSGGTEPFPEGESTQQFKERSVRAFLRGLARLSEQKIEIAAFVVHGGTIMAVMERLCRTEKQYFDWQVGNGQGFLTEADSEEIAEAVRKFETEQTASRFLTLAESLPLDASQVHESGIEQCFVVRKNQRMQCGYTTGSCAAAASMAAVRMLFEQKPCREIRLTTPKGTVLLLETEFPVFDPHSASCAVRKFGGDDPDATDGLLIFAKAERTDGSDAEAGDFLNGTALTKDGAVGDSSEPGAEDRSHSEPKAEDPDFSESDHSQKKAADVLLKAGAGIGRVTKPGLEQPVGAAAVNRVPRKMITEGVRAVCEEFHYSGMIRITLRVQGGEAVGARTFNPHLGIEGGISILGTSGIVVPMSEQALIESIRIEMRQKVHGGEQYLLITPGNYGADFLKSAEQFRILDPDRSMKCSNYVGETLDIAMELGVKGILFVSHIGKFGKVSGGIMNTHSAHADCRAELMAAQAMRAGASRETVLQVLESNTTEEAVGILKKSGDLDGTIRVMLEKIQFYLDKHCQGELRTEVVLFSSQYGYLGETEGAEDLLLRIAEEDQRLHGETGRE